MNTTTGNNRQKRRRPDVTEPGNNQHTTTRQPVSPEQLKAIMAKIEASVAAVEVHIDQYLKGKYALV